MKISPGAQVQSALVAHEMPMRDARPAVHRLAVQTPIGSAAGVASVTVTLMPVVQLCSVRRSNATVPHWRALGFAPTRVGMFAQSLTLEFAWSFGWRSDHWKYMSSMVHPVPPPVPACSVRGRASSPRRHHGARRLTAEILLGFFDM